MAKLFGETWQNIEKQPQFLYVTKEAADQFQTKALLGMKNIRITAVTIEDSDGVIDLAKHKVHKLIKGKDDLNRTYYYDLYLK